MSVATTRLSRNDELRIVSLDCKRLIEEISPCINKSTASTYRNYVRHSLSVCIVVPIKKQTSDVKRPEKKLGSILFALFFSEDCVHGFTLDLKYCILLYRLDGVEA